MIAHLRLLLLLMVAWPGFATAQTREVFPGQLKLEVTIENGEVTPLGGEMILVTIHGIYRRHITRERLEQPDLDGFNWMQLGEDYWYETQEAGRPVKNFKRRMALFPDRAGELEIGPFVHHLTLTDEGDDWFDHAVSSDPMTIHVDPAPTGANEDEWWFPVRRLEISDEWSNAPDQLAEGEGVLRVIKVTAVGAAPDMIPPMPELTSPSAMIFPHPEKRFVELSPQGPVSIAFWRWTIRPTNGTSAILEPIEFAYFDTTTRTAHTVSISAQRVAMEEAATPAPVAEAPSARLYRAWAVAAALAAFALGLGGVLWGRGFSRAAGIAALPGLDPLRRGLRRAARRGDLGALRRNAVRLAARDGATPLRRRLLASLDRALFAPGAAAPDPRGFVRDFLSRKARRSGAETAPTNTEG